MSKPLSMAHYDALGNGLAVGDTVKSNALPTFGRYATVESIHHSGVLVVRWHLSGKLANIGAGLVNLVNDEAR